LVASNVPMDPSVDPVVGRMESLVSRWDEAADQRMYFLRCYLLTTQNIIKAITVREFMDCDWVNQLMHRFADYYFVALDRYEYDPADAPSVWRLAHDATRDPELLPVQKMLIGMSAHINYDLVLSLVDLLRPEWAELSVSKREERYLDHCHINQVIGRTIDAVQDQIVNPTEPILGLFDKLLGPLDEWLVSLHIAGWRDTSWHEAIELLESGGPDRRLHLIGEIEAQALRHAAAISLKDWRAALDEL